ncbi:MAG: DUF1214 domain-containing protein [Sphingomonas sp.]|uniref:DUF1214 domain-containing protein n=1 Tax=Sphingomonas TaxID=13687 RepID=UPI000929BA83|nr:MULTISPECIES: DUF1214 domain-containing protein [Sphingomonas]MBV8237494.1 DUF1214 domain-containing protein [Sphingomonas sp.]MCW6531169.1 DUF1214 domain-containing protein [Sphingomonas lycopersici]OJU14696.1 MAG: hypothetical protein BGN95_22610 [Sphingomonas sp. 66-10]
MKPLVRYLVLGVVGVVAGLGSAIYTVRAGALGSNVQIGPWTTGMDFGTADQSMRTRAVVALRGLLALPAREARYYTASVDDAGRPLNGRCSYRITGGQLPGRWWSLTLYDSAGYLTGGGPYSVESAAIPAENQARWTVLVSPVRQQGLWLPTAGLKHFDLTLRTYLPPDEGRTNPARDQLPSIRQEACS